MKEAYQVENKIARVQKDGSETSEQDKMRLMTRDRIERDDEGQDQVFGICKG